MSVDMNKVLDLTGTTELIDTKEACIAPVESTSTASQAYAVGQRFWYAGKLYIATADIASGGTITPNTNCKLDVLGDDLTSQSEKIDALKETTQNLFTGVVSNANGFSYDNGVFTNTKTDSRANFQLQITVFDASNNVVANSNAVTIYSKGRYTQTVTVSGDGTKVRIKHNGSSRDLQIYFSASTVSGKTYTFSCVVSSYDPTTNGGIVFSEAMFEEGSNPTPYTPYETGIDYIARGNANKAIANNDYIRTTDAVITSKLTQIATTYTDDYYFDRTVSGFKTSDYIAVEHDMYQLYAVMFDIFTSNYRLIVLYDKDKLAIGQIMGGLPSHMRGIPLKLTLPQNCAYIRYIQQSSGVTAGAGIYKGYFTSFDDAVFELVSTNYTGNNNALWIGTSIPEGAQYPAKSCEANGYNCINKSLGSSKLCFTNQHPTTVQEYSGRCLTATVAELEALYRADVTGGTITEDTLNAWKNYSYENSILPYINGTNETQVSMIVLDHGFNDRATIHTQMQDAENIDWTSDDRSTFTGAFKYLIDKIQVANPFVKIVISGYFTNTVITLGSDSYYSDEICELQTMIGQHYNITVLDAWNHTQISNQFVDGTDDYLSNFNTEYGTSYTALVTDANGNITSLQLYCPDGMHPHSDRTGNCNKRLNAVYTKLLAHMI